MSKNITKKLYIELLNGESLVIDYHPNYATSSNRTIISHFLAGDYFISKCGYSYPIRNVLRVKVLEEESV